MKWNLTCASRDSQDILYPGENVLCTGTFPVWHLFPRLWVQPGELVLSQSQTHAALLPADPHQAHRRNGEWVSEKGVQTFYKYRLVTWNLPDVCAGLAAAFPVASVWTVCRNPPGATPTCVSLFTNTNNHHLSIYLIHYTRNSIIIIIIIAFPCNIFPVFMDSFNSTWHTCLEKEDIFIKKNKNILALCFLPKSAANDSGSGTLRFWEQKEETLFINNVKLCLENT